MSTLPLAGVRVLDFTWVLIGPQASEYLATLGADVIRIESAVQPDITRRLSLMKDGVPGLNRNGVFNSVNRGKRSVLLNFGSERGVELTRALVRAWQPDILLENQISGSMARRGLGYQDIAAIKPDIVYCSMSLLGQTGPEHWYRGWGPNLQCRTGISWLSGHPHDPVPVALGGTYPDYNLAGLVVFSALTALWHRQQTGEGQHIDFAQNEAVMHTLADAMLDATMNGRELGMNGNREPLFVPQGVYRCAGTDDWVAISVADDAAFAALCRVLGQPQLAHDPRFSGVLARAEHHDALDALIGAWTRERGNREAQDTLQAAGVTAGAVVDSEQLLTDPQLRARGFFHTIDHPEVGPAEYGGWPVHLSDAPTHVARAPLFGEHTREVYAGILGLSDAEIEELTNAQVIY